MAPEQIRAARTVDARTDVYGLGATMYQLLTGMPPFVALNLYVLCARILSDAPAPLHRTRKDIPKVLEAVVLRCLAKDPAARYASVLELAEALDDARGAPAIPRGPERALEEATTEKDEVRRERPAAGDPFSTQREQDRVTMKGRYQPPSIAVRTTREVAAPSTEPSPTADPESPPRTQRLPRPS
jgi:serine/threonine-protein kinase